MSLVSQLSVSEACVQVMSRYSFRFATPGNCTGFLFPSGVSELFLYFLKLVVFSDHYSCKIPLLLPAGCECKLQEDHHACQTLENLSVKGTLFLHIAKGNIR